MPRNTLPPATAGVESVFVPDLRDPADVLRRGQVDSAALGSFSPGTNDSGRPFSSETMLWRSVPPHCGQSAANMPRAETAKRNAITHVPAARMFGPSWPPEPKSQMTKCSMFNEREIVILIGH